jgi:predicted CXXCH cytochrome family protein
MHAGVTWVTIIAATTQEPIAIEHRLSWVSQNKSMRVTPGHEGRQVEQPVEIFGHPHLTKGLKQCFDCHSTHFTLQGTQIVDLRAGVGCQNCHGPGSQHVAAMESGGSEVNLRYPSENSTPMDEVRLCGACHRLPEDLSPGEIVRSNRELPRMQSVGLLQSRCFTESAGLSCSTCHDPHASAHVATRASYEQTCFACHSQPSQTTCPTTKSQGCVQCHMPQIDVIPDMPFHDHWIRIRTDQDPKPISIQDASAKPSEGRSPPVD